MSSPGFGEKFPLPSMKRGRERGRKNEERRVSPSLTQEKERRKERLPVVHLAEFILIDRIRRNKRNEAANASGYYSIVERSEILLL